MLLILSGILLKTMQVGSYAKTLHHIFIPPTYKDFKYFFYSYLRQIEILELVCLFDFSNRKN